MERILLCKTSERTHTLPLEVSHKAVNSKDDLKEKWSTINTAFPSRKALLGEDLTGGLLTHHYTAQPSLILSLIQITHINQKTVRTDNLQATARCSAGR